jgi:hypothetical protein
MQLPRITSNIFIDQSLYMQLLGILVGLGLPAFLSNGVTLSKEVIFMGTFTV